MFILTNTYNTSKLEPKTENENQLSITTCVRVSSKKSVVLTIIQHYFHFSF